MKCVILMAGKGERLSPMTNTRPKALIPVANKVLLDYLVDATIGLVDGYVFVVNYMQDKIMEHVKTSYPDIDVRFVVQEEINGTGGALMCADCVDEPFLCLNGDIFIEHTCIRDAISKHYSSGKQVVSVKPMENDGRYGSVIEQGGRLCGIEEKSSTGEQSLVNIGVYIFTPDIFAALRSIPCSPRGEYELTDAIVACCDDMVLHIYEGYWNDIGYPWSILEANEFILSSQESDIRGIVEPGASLFGNISIGEGTRVRSGAYIVGPVKVGDGCDIGPNCFIRPSTTIGNNCHVGNATEIKNSVIFDNTNAAHLSYVGDTVIGEFCNLGAGTLIANLRHKKDPVKMEIKGKIVSSKRRKLGAVIGDNTKTGINVSIYEGRKIGNGCGIGPGVIVDRNIPNNTLVLAEQTRSYIRKDKR